MLFCTIGAMAQSKNHKFGITAGGSIQQYNGNLGNTFLKFNSICFGGAVTTFGVYINKSLEFNLGGTVAQYGYHPQHENGKEVPLEQRCPGCIGLGMGELRSLMISGNIGIKYKFANDLFLKEKSKLAPYVYVGMGINHLSDNMKRRCVNVGYHYTINGGAGIKYNLNERFNIGYNLGIGCFIFKKVYNTNATASDSFVKDADYLKTEKRKDLYMQHSWVLGVNF